MSGKGWRLVLLLLATSLLLLVSGCDGGEQTKSVDHVTVTPPSGAGSSGLGKVAYSLNGEIYVRVLPDGGPKRIAEGTSPRWSPSGEWLLFFLGGSDWVMRADGSDRRPLSGDGAVLSPTEDRFAYYQGPVGRNPSTSLLVESADGSSRQEAWLLATPWSGPIWSPDGKRLAYSQEGAVPCSMDPHGGEDNNLRRSSLCVVDANAGEARTRPVDLYDSTKDGLLAAGWSADSEYVLFWLDPEFANSAMNDGLPTYSVPASGGEPRELTFSLLAGVWEPVPQDSATIVMTEGASRFTWTYQRVALADLATGDVTYLTGEDTASQQPDLSPDGRRIAFVSQPDTGPGPGGSGEELQKLCADRRIWVMNADGSGKRQLTDDPQYRDERPLWSKDGSRILFARLDEERRASLWLVSAGGGDPQRVVALQDVGIDSGCSIGWGGMFDWWRGP